MDDPNAMDDMDVCVLARRGSSKEGTVLRFTILNEEKEKKKELFIPPHAHSIVLGKDGIYENSVFTMEKDEVEYKLKSVNFTRAEKSFIDSGMKKEDFSSLFVIDPSTARIIVDPIVRMKDNGFYDVTIEAMKDNETIGEFKREIHSVPSSSQVRLVFDMTTHELGRNLETSSVCVHVLLNSSLMPQSTAFSLLSLPPSDSPLTNLYHSYKVSNLGTCDASISVSSLISSSFSSSFIITSSIVSLLSFILISSILYVCCVLRERDRCRKMENSMNKESESPQMGAPGQFYSLTGTQAMITPYGLY
ncbi:hypothetical protein PRIPAC_77070 [Pristionchus pacificus]|uniref:Cadherin domain-containing protein n=1 Tax=Pristionchus pacificus TaxID=54126 RepID=A0A8R1V263_PRIPA|nr:hypothetical protein PRIPAC_77070 [Pristionchus pacificus]